MKHASRLPRARRAFTLMEILIVIALLGGILALVATNLIGTFDKSSADIEKLKVTQSFSSALMQYKLNVGAYPSTEEGLKALLVAPEGKADNWKGPYINGEKDLVDSFKAPYGYRYPGVNNPSKYDLWSKGPDGQDGTADDIGNWEAGK